MKKPKHSPSWWCFVLSLIMGVISALSGVLIIKGVSTSDLCVAICGAGFIGFLIFMAFHISLGTDELTLKPGDEEELDRFLADVYILAWKYYQGYESNITKAWLFQSARIMRNIKRKCVENALNERCYHSYKGCCFYVSEKTSDDGTLKWRLTIRRTEILAHSNVQTIMDNIPDLATAFDYDLASKATDVKLIQSTIPPHEDPRTTTIQMPVWDDGAQKWRMQAIKREERNVPAEKNQ